MAQAAGAGAPPPPPPGPFSLSRLSFFLLLLTLYLGVPTVISPINSFSSAGLSQLLCVSGVSERRFCLDRRSTYRCHARAACNISRHACAYNLDADVTAFLSGSWVRQHAGGAECFATPSDWPAFLRFVLPRSEVGARFRRHRPSEKNIKQEQYWHMLA